MAFLPTALFAVLLSTFAAFQSPLQAQTFQVIHQFTGREDQGIPANTMAIDRAGNLYGTTAFQGLGPYGTVFRMERSGSSWIFNKLYTFRGKGDGVAPYEVVVGTDGVVYGATYGNTDDDCCGLVYELRPSPQPCKSVLCSWTETVLHRFDIEDENPSSGALALDEAGNLYGATDGFGTDEGVVYKLTRSGGWGKSILYSFPGGSGGGFPVGGVIFDSQGRLYGTTSEGGDYNCSRYGCGIVYQLTDSGSGWTETVLHTFETDGSGPTGLTMDSLGNLYGATAYGGQGYGIVFELTPFNGNWIYTQIYSFSGSGRGGTLKSSLTMDGAGNLYGTTVDGGTYGYGNVYKLKHSSGGWTYTSLHDFTGRFDGGLPFGGVAVDANGTLYGTASDGGAYYNCDGYCGVVWEITP